MVCLCPLLQGCIAILVEKQHTEVINNPVISLHPKGYPRPVFSREMALRDMAISAEFKEANRQIGADHETGGNDKAIARAIANATNHVVWVVYTPAWLQTHWGAPNRISKAHSGGDEVWTYRFKLIWEGITPILILPIPLELPLGEQKVRFTLHDGKVVSASLTMPSETGKALFFPRDR